MKTTPTTHLEDYKFNPKEEWPGSLSLVSKAWRVVRDSPDFVYLFVGILGLLSLINYLVAPVPFFSVNISSDTGTSNSSLVVTAIATLVSLILTGPLTLYQLRVSNDKKVSVSAVLRTGLSRIIPFIALNLVLVACVMLGLLLFIVPGIIIALRLVMANYLFFDKNLGPVEALKKSFELTKGNFSETVGYVGTIILLSLLTGIISLFVPVFGDMLAYAAVVVYGVIGAWLYRWMTKQR